MEVQGFAVSSVTSQNTDVLMYRHQLRYWCCIDLLRTVNRNRLVRPDTIHRTLNNLHRPIAQILYLSQWNFGMKYGIII